jgi:hypothetical protein
LFIGGIESTPVAKHITTKQQRHHTHIIKSIFPQMEWMEFGRRKTKEARRQAGGLTDRQGGMARYDWEGGKSRHKNKFCFQRDKHVSFCHE